MHIGLIGGIGPAATEFYYRGLIDRYALSEMALDLTIAHADVREMGRNLANRDTKKQAEVFAELLRRLRAAGAKIAAVTSMGGHFCIGELEAISAIPVVNALPVVGAAIAERAYKMVGIIGTRMVMETRLYGVISSATVLVPEDDEFEEVQANYGAMAMHGRVTDSQRLPYAPGGRTRLGEERHLCVSSFARGADWSIEVRKLCSSAEPICSSHFKGRIAVFLCSTSLMCTSTRSFKGR